MTMRWDIFCKVVDNFGDAGVAWRLARQLVHEHSLKVRLWLDDLRPLARMAPGVEAHRETQFAAGVEVCRWHATFADTTPADAVVETFGCGLPESYSAAMTRCSPAPVWFVLEYLSAEEWIDGSHGLPSPHPQLPLTRRFWFPGFTLASGGLLRERGLIEARNAFQRDAVRRDAFWASLALPSPATGERRVSLYCYPDLALPALFDAWADGDDLLTCIVPDGVATGALDAWTGGNMPHAGRPVSRGRLTLHGIPFLSQQAYDHLLWACDVNVVRGEDSFVRAQWAARPFLWHIYPQAEDAHRCKLDAFIGRYVSALDSRAAAAARACFEALNGVPCSGGLDVAWQSFAAATPALERHGVAWSAELAELPDLASGLVNAASIQV